MIKSEIEKIKKTLISELELIDKNVIDLKKNDPFNDPDHSSNNAAVDNDVREQEAHQRIEAEIESLLERKENIKQAISRILKGRYGYCKRCSKEILRKRLDLIPETNYCVSCESELKK